mmetsp:Transcript_150668/g.365871  ORF Transcript_150668/g.365871 Transcript_150668/m.365871 type:complete len:223 (+) Transcript_150668:210-878(+)
MRWPYACAEHAHGRLLLTHAFSMQEAALKDGHASICLCDQADTAQLPVRRVYIRAQQEPENQVAVVALRVLVHSRIVGSEWPIIETQRFPLPCCCGSDVDRRHCHEELLRLRLVKLALHPVPSRALNEHSMYMLALVRHVAHLLRVVLEHLSVGDHVVKCPLVLLVLPSDLLAHAREKALCIGEVGEAVGLHHTSAVLQPSMQHRLAVKQASEPPADVRHEP